MFLSQNNSCPFLQAELCSECDLLNFQVNLLDTVANGIIFFIIIQVIVLLANVLASNTCKKNFDIGTLRIKNSFY